MFSAFRRSSIIGLTFFAVAFFVGSHADAEEKGNLNGLWKAGRRAHPVKCNHAGSKLSCITTKIWSCRSKGEKAIAGTIQGKRIEGTYFGCKDGAVLNPLVMKGKVKKRGRVIVIKYIVELNDGEEDERKIVLRR